MVIKNNHEEQTWGFCDIQNNQVPRTVSADAKAWGSQLLPRVQILAFFLVFTYLFV